MFKKLMAGLDQIRKDALRLSQFLGKPVWDAI